MKQGKLKDAWISFASFHGAIQWTLSDAILQYLFIDREFTIAKGTGLVANYGTELNFF